MDLIFYLIFEQLVISSNFFPYPYDMHSSTSCTNHDMRVNNLRFGTKGMHSLITGFDSNLLDNLMSVEEFCFRGALSSLAEARWLSQLSQMKYQYPCCYAQTFYQ